MSPRHTPGPWTLTDENRARRVIKGGGDKPRTVAIIEDWTTEPDAALIAAAPELLEALKTAAEALRKFRGPGSYAADDAYDEATRAIAKAEGRS